MHTLVRQLSERARYLFGATKGLILVAIALIALTTALMGTLSGPMQSWGVTDFVVRRFGLRLVEAERDGRIVLLYHAIAVTVVAIETYLITETVPMKHHEQAAINATITVGYLLTLIFSLAFGYFGHNFAFHGLFLLGLSLSFFAGLQLAVALFPLRSAFPARGRPYAHLGKVDLERVAFFTMSVATLGSAALGGVTGAFYGNGFEAFLAEDIVRELHKTPLQLAVIGHLHIMLTLIAIAAALLVGRWLDFQGFWHKLSMPCFIIGTIVITLGAWAVVPFESIAHTIIYGGSTIVLLGALFLVIFGFDHLIRETGTMGDETRMSPRRKLQALTRDPLKFGALWQMVFMNFVVTGPGLFMAANLHTVFRAWPAAEERPVLAGHWHVLAGLVATILLLRYADLAGLQGRWRRIFGWTVIAFSDLAFAAATAYTLKRLLVRPGTEAALVRATTLLLDVGLGAVLLALGALMGWRLVDLFRQQGRWRHEADEHRIETPVL